MAMPRNRGKKKQTLRDLSRVWPTAEEKNAVRNKLIELENPPIVTAILGAALLEYELEARLRKKFRRKDDDTWKALTEERGSLGSFDAKITTAYAFGLFDAVVRDGIHTVRRIRNAFAHTKKLVDFKHELVVKELATVTMPKSNRHRLHKYLSDVKGLKADKAQQSFILLCLILEIDLLRGDTKAATARFSARERSIRKQLATAIAEPPALPYPIAGLGKAPLWFRANRTGDPKSLLGSSEYVDELLRLAGRPSTKGK
jgi:hypothetical protein